MLSVSELVVRYGQAVAVRGIGLQAGAGRVTALIGRNGAGKSTTLQSIAGYVKRTSGSIRLFDSELPNGYPRICVERGVVYIPETRRLFGALTVAENLAVAARVRARRTNGKYTPELFRSRFELVNRVWKRTTRTLSGGEQQIVAICRALCSNPLVLLGDELYQGLAPPMAKLVTELIVEYVDGGGITMIVEQNVGIIKDLIGASGYVYVLESGLIRAAGRWDEVEESGILESAVGIRVTTDPHRNQGST